MKPKFSPDQDMMNVSPQDAKDAKIRDKESKAYDKASSIKPAMKKAKGGAVKKYAKGGMVRGDGCAQRGKTKGRMV